VKIGLVQQHATPDKSQNIRRGLSAIDEAAVAGARIIAFAELAFERFHPQRPASPDSLTLAEPVPRSDHRRVLGACPPTPGRPRPQPV
jgi:N-carbamoylputrescine amidase